MNGKAGSRSSKRRSGSAASNSESELTFGTSTLSQAKTDSMSEHSLTSPRKPKYQQARHSPSPSRADKGAIGDVGNHELERLTFTSPTESQGRGEVSEGQGESGKKDSSDYSDPVYQKLSRINGEINQMHKEELRQRLSELHLHTGGVKQVLKKRLKNYYKRQKLVAANLKNGVKDTLFDYLLVIDFEATCQENNNNFVHEIIEFPAVLVDVEKREIVGMFREFCKPRLNPVLTEFCKQLTGVNQSEVDSAGDFTEVLQKFENWMQARGLGTEHSFAIVTDGPWDIQRFLCKQCEISEIPFPRWGRKWINIRKIFCNFYDSPRYNLETMLHQLGLEFEGRPHCGLDDSKNIARVAINLLLDGCTMKYNEKYDGCPVLSNPKPSTSPNWKPSVPSHANSSTLSKCVVTGGGMQSGDHVTALQEKTTSHKSRLAHGGGLGGESAVHCTKETTLVDALEADSGEDVSDLLTYFKLQSS